MLDAAFFSNELLPALNRGLLVSIALIIPAGSLGFVGGVLLGCARAFGPRWLRRLGNGYTSLIRGVPLAVQLMMIYYALPKLGIFFSPFGAALTSFRRVCGVRRASPPSERWNDMDSPSRRLRPRLSK